MLQSRRMRAPYLILPIMPPLRRLVLGCLHLAKVPIGDIMSELLLARMHSPLYMSI